MRQLFMSIGLGLVMLLSICATLSMGCDVEPCPEELASGNLGMDPSINSLGEVVWSRYDQASSNNQIYSSNHGQLTSNGVYHGGSAVNNLGDLVWMESFWDEQQSRTVYSVKGIMAGQPVTIWTSQYWIGKVDINDRGEVVWEQRDDLNVSQIYSNLRGQLTEGSGGYLQPGINNQGDLVFYGFSNGQIFHLAAGSSSPVAITSAITDYFAPYMSVQSPVILDNGDILWAEQPRNSAPAPYRLVSRNSGILVDSLGDQIGGLDLNACGDLVYTAFTPQGTVLYLFGHGAPCISTPDRLFSLAVGKSPMGTGTGQVQSTPSGISIGSTENSALAAFSANSTVTLSASSDANSFFTGWSGACSGTAACVVMMDMAKSVTATFDLLSSDTTDPVTTATPAGGVYNAVQSVALSCADGTGSGCNAMFYCIGTGCNPTTLYNSAVNIVESADLRFYSTDVAGNSEEVKTESYLIEIVLPTASISGTPESPTHAATATLIVGGSDVVSYKFKLDAGAYSAETPVANPIGLASLSEGTHTVYVLGKSSSGNWQVTPTSASWTVDLPVSVPGGGSFLGVQEAYNSLVSDNVLLLKGINIVESLVFDRNLLVTLRGGYDEVSGTCTGLTSIQGSLVIGAGTVIMENLVIM